jgi:hypothetical protein
MDTLFKGRLPSRRSNVAALIDQFLTEARRAISCVKMFTSVDIELQ